MDVASVAGMEARKFTANQAYLNPILSGLMLFESSACNKVGVSTHCPTAVPLNLTAEY